MKKNSRRKFIKKSTQKLALGYFTSEVGIKELGYKGNSPNIWDGVPQDVLDQYGLEYDKDWLDKFVDQSKRND